MALNLDKAVLALLMNALGRAEEAVGHLKICYCTLLMILVLKTVFGARL